MPTFSTHTLGCRANQADTDRLAEILRGAGYQEVSFGQPADCQIVNTCTITKEADRKSAQVIRRAERQGGQVVVTGCAVAERGGLSRRLPGSVLRLPPDRRDEILTALGAEHCPSGAALEATLGRRTRALLRIQDGCDQFCTFCIVPYVRGRSRGMPLEEVVERARRLEAQGFAEIVLTGIHLSAWEADGKDLCDLVSALLASTQTVRFRLGSVEPDLFPARLFALMAAHPQRLCRHLHLVLQHASERILERMHRGYDLARYESLVAAFTELPGACLTTDLMVGFPGETDADFREMLRYVRRTPFYRIHVFPYSPRPGTAAARFAEAVEPSIVSQRREALQRLAEKKRLEFIRASRGQERWVLCEQGQDPGWAHGTADNYLNVKIRGNRDPGTLVRVRISGRRGDWAVGAVAF